MEAGTEAAIALPMRMTAATFQRLYSMEESVVERHVRESSNKAARSSMETQDAREPRDRQVQLSAKDQLRATGRAQVRLAPAQGSRSAPRFIPALIRV